MDRDFGASSLYLAVMAGGSGTRFWPKSTSKKPKQLLSFEATSENGASSLLARTLSRFKSLVPKTQQMILTTQKLENAVRAEAPGVEVLAEPQGRNTAPCIYWAARKIAEKNPKGVMLVMPSDHWIAHPERFVETVKLAAARAAHHDELVALGVQPSRPETGYGYLKAGERVDEEGCRRVEAFVEKPGIEKAREFLRSGNYLWNGGMFLWRAETILRAFDTFMPELKKAWETARGEVEAAYPKMTATSIDYGIMEKAQNVVSFPLDCGWDDLGSWVSLEGLADRLGAKHAAGVVSAGECLAIDSEGNIVDAPGKLVALLGAKDLIIVEQGNALLIARKDRAQDIRLVVEEVKKKKPELA